MSSGQPVCFVISPIGPDGSEVRSAADDFLELLVEPVLAGFDYNVVRADRLVTPTAITADIVRLVQDAELCIIDLTGHNANVFYECGRRHETGKPFIQMVSKSWESRLPFDVAGIRTLTYDLSSARAVLASQKVLSDFVSAISKGEASAGSLGVSISTVALGLERVERKIDMLVSSPTQWGPSANQGAQEDSLKLMMMQPREAFITSLRRGQFDTAFGLRDRLKKSLSAKEYRAAIGLMASTGYEPISPLLRSEIDEVLSDESGESAGQSLRGLAQSFRLLYTNSGRLAEGLELAEGLLPSVLSSHIPAHVQAGVLNQMGMLAWSNEEYVKCADFSLRASKLDTTEPAYVYNLALAWKELERDEEFQSSLDTLAAFPELKVNQVQYLMKHGRTFNGTVSTGEKDDDES